MSYQDVFKKIKDNIYIDKKIQIYRLHYNYLKTCLKYPNDFQVDKSKYSHWNLAEVKDLPFDKWWKTRGLRLLGRELETVREIKTTSFNSRPNTIAVEIPIDVPFQFSLKQIKNIIKNKTNNQKQRVDERNHYLKLEDYLKTWHLKKQGYTLREIRRKLSAHRKLIIKKRGRRSAMDRTTVEKYLKYRPSLIDKKYYNPMKAKDPTQIKSLERQINRFRQHADKILENVCKGIFPGKYWN